MEKSKRNAVYKLALKHYENYLELCKKQKKTPYFGLCCSIMDAAVLVFGEEVYSFDPYYFMKDVYPEIWKHKPKPENLCGDYWWDQGNSEIRISVLKQAIEETKQ